MAIHAVLFDFDGTLTEPGALDFAAIRAAIGCPSGQPILEYIDRLVPGADSERVRSILDGFEADAAARSRPNRGAEAIVALLRARGLRVGIITRNSRSAVDRAFGNFPRLRASDFDVVLTRDDGLIPKPSPDGVHEAARRMNAAARDVLVVGDFVYDVEAGRRAGARTALLTNRGPGHPLSDPPDFTIDELEDLVPIVRRLAPLAQGKLPNDLLEPLLDGLAAGDSGLLVAPGVGQDFAAARLSGEEVLVLKTDPITFASDAAARYAVTVNCNDVATSGADPRWLLATLLFPPGTCLDEVEQMMRELRDTAREAGVALCGGHTEITDAVTRPVVVAQVAGTVAAARLIDKRRVGQGDRIYLTKRIAVEGTCLIARELGDELARLGMTAGEIARCRRFLASPGISVVPEARIAAQYGATAMHDVTEGGVATALEELSTASGRKLRVERDRIPVYDETLHLCRLLEIDALGLIASGSLLVAAPAEHCRALESAMTDSGIELHRIGEALESGIGIEARLGGEPTDWPRFDVDEVARLFARRRA